MTSGLAPTPQEVSAAVAGWLRARFEAEVIEVGDPARISGGFDFWIYGLQFAGEGLPPGWTAPLVARIPPTSSRFAALEAESRLQDWSARHGFPAPAVLAVLPPGEMFAQPVQLVERVPGRTMTAAMTTRPWRVSGLVGALADLHARLHDLPLPDGADRTDSVIDRRLSGVRFAIEQLPGSGLAAGLERVQDLLPALEVPDPVICHGDFHPLNVLVDGRAVFSVIDWTDAGIGDRHADVARTAWLFGFAGVAAPGRANRAALRTLAPVLARHYLKVYGRRGRLDPRRLRLWKPLHLLHAWAMFAVDEAEVVGPSRAGTDFRIGLADWAQEQFRQAIIDL